MPIKYPRMRMESSDSRGEEESKEGEISEGELQTSGIMEPDL
jgi:hypothetical protein